MAAPAIAPYPPATFRKQLVPEEWEACLDAWISLTEYYLRVSPEGFQAALSGDNESITRFLLSYYRETSQDHGISRNQASPKTHVLHRLAFLLTHRSILEVKSAPKALLNWTFVSDFSHAYSKSHSLEAFLDTLWQKRQSEIEASLKELKASLLKRLESAEPSAAENDLKRLAPLLRSSRDAGVYLTAGSDLIDALMASYKAASQSFRQRIVVVTYLGLVACLKGDRPNHSMLFDHLYSLKALAGKAGNDVTLLSDLVTNTPLLAKLSSSVTGKDAERAHTLATSLAPYRSSALARPRNASRRRAGKGKAPEKDSFGHGAVSNEQHMHSMSLITQIQDLFPDLGSAFIARLLEEYSESVEQVTAHLLDESLPPHLSGLDRAAQLPPSDNQPTSSDHLAPRSTPPPSSIPQRRNVFDDDEFDRLEHDTARLHIGRANPTQTADALLSTKQSTETKSAILSALAAFDSDDDERDDTYDQDDVGGTVDTAAPDGETSRDVRVDTEDPNEETLFRAWKMDPSTFARGAETRKSPARAAMKSETGMTDEALEGWGLMLARDPKRIRRLEGKYSGFDGQQETIGRTSYRAGETDDSDGSERDGFRGRGRGRGMGRGRGRGGGRGGNVAGLTGESGTQVSRQRKEASKGSRANHNRRDQRARKMARGGFPG
ncbi:hypothetical protein MBLNU457_5074t1 [Dothideomycetes sp. NU457]